MSSKCTAAKAYDILGIYDFPDNFDALNGLHSYLYTNSDMVVEALEDLSGLPFAENCSGLDIDMILQRPKCLG